MEAGWEPTSNHGTTERIEQLTLRLPEVELSEERCEIVNEIAEVSILVRQRIEVIQQFISAEGTERYGKVQVQGVVGTWHLKMAKWYK